MLLGIFDILQIQEYHGHITDWWAIILTIIGTGLVSGVVAFLAAWLQIRNQKKHEKSKDKERREFLKNFILKSSNLLVKESIEFAEKMVDSNKEFVFDENPVTESRFIENSNLTNIINLKSEDIHAAFDEYLNENQENYNFFRNYIGAIKAIQLLYTTLQDKRSDYHSIIEFHKDELEKCDIELTSKVFFLIYNKNLKPEQIVKIRDSYQLLLDNPKAGFYVNIAHKLTTMDMLFKDDENITDEIIEFISFCRESILNKSTINRYYSNIISLHDYFQEIILENLEIVEHFTESARKFYNIPVEYKI